MIARRLRPLRLACGLFQAVVLSDGGRLRSCQPLEIFVVQQPGRHARVRVEAVLQDHPRHAEGCREADDPVIIGVVRAVPADARLRGLQRSHRLMDALRQLGSQADPLPADRIKDDGIVHAFADPVSRCVAVQAEEQIAVLRRQRAGIERRVVLPRGARADHGHAVGLQFLLQQALQRKHPVALKVAAPCGALILAGPMAGIETNFHAALLLSCCVPK